VLRDVRRDFGLVNRPENIIFCTKVPSSSDIVIADFGVHIPWTSSPETCPICASLDFAVPSISIPEENHSRPLSEVCVLYRSRGTQPKGAPEACRSLVNWLGLYVLLADHSWYGGVLSTVRIAASLLTCYYADTRPSGQVPEGNDTADDSSEGGLPR